MISVNSSGIQNTKKNTCKWPLDNTNCAQISMHFIDLFKILWKSVEVVGLLRYIGLRAECDI